MSEDIMNLHLVEESNSKIIVHPSVPIQILELFYRSAEQVQDKSPNPMKDQQIMGILLGRILPDQVQITNCYVSTARTATSSSRAAPEPHRTALVSFWEEECASLRARAGAGALACALPRLSPCHPVWRLLTCFIPFALNVHGQPDHQERLPQP